MKKLILILGLIFAFGCTKDDETNNVNCNCFEVQYNQNITLKNGVWTVGSWYEVNRKPYSNCGDNGKILSQNQYNQTNLIINYKRVVECK